MSPYSKNGWTDRWVLDVEGDNAVTSYELVLTVVPGPSVGSPPHCFVATVTIAQYVQVREPNTHDNWESRDPVIIYRAEHLSLVAGVRGARKAAKRAELIRKGPSDE